MKSRHVFRKTEKKYFFQFNNVEIQKFHINLIGVRDLSRFYIKVGITFHAVGNFDPFELLISIAQNFDHENNNRQNQTDAPYNESSTDMIQSQVYKTRHITMLR